MRAIATAALALLCLTGAPAPAQSAEAAQAETPVQQWLGTLTLARPELLDPARWSDKDQAIAGEHFGYWKALTERGSVVLVGRTLDQDSNGHLAPDTVGLVIFEAPDRAAAEGIISSDPGIKAGVWRYKLASYQVALKR